MKSWFTAVSSFALGVGTLVMVTSMSEQSVVGKEPRFVQLKMEDLNEQQRPLAEEIFKISSASGRCCSLRSSILSCTKRGSLPTTDCSDIETTIANVPEREARHGGEPALHQRAPCRSSVAPFLLVPPEDLALRPVSKPLQLNAERAWDGF